MRKTTKTKALAALLALAMALSLTACGHQHTWADATCTAPKTCTECGETEGEALGHSWEDATCAAPKTCSVCKETEGEALPHTWQDVTCAAPKTCSVCGETEGEALPHTLTEANYQSPAVCTVCGAEVGEPLTPAFESGDVDTSNFQSAELGVAYEYHGVSNNDRSVQQTNHVTFEAYDVVPFDDTHEAKDGYEWQILQLHYICDDPTVQTLGWATGYNFFDYYSGVPVEADTFTLNFNGTDYECRQITKEDIKWSSDYTVSDYLVEVSMQVPVGYDGIVIAATDIASGEEFDSILNIKDGLADLSGFSLRYMRLGA